MWLGGWAPSEEGVRADPADTVFGASMPLKIGEQHACAMFVHFLIVLNEEQASIPLKMGERHTSAMSRHHHDRLDK